VGFLKGILEAIKIKTDDPSILKAVQRGLDQFKKYHEATYGTQLLGEVGAE